MMGVVVALATTGLATCMLVLHFLMTPDGHAGYVALSALLTGLLSFGILTLLAFKR